MLSILPMRPQWKASTIVMISAFMIVMLMLALAAGFLAEPQPVEHFIDSSSPKIHWVGDNPMNIEFKPDIYRLEKATLGSFDVKTWPDIFPAAPDLPINLKAPATATVLAVDPLDAGHWSGRPTFQMPTGYIVGLANLTAALGMTCGHDWVGRTIGYTDRTSLLFILTVLHGHRIARESVRIVRVPKVYWDKLEEVLTETVGVIVTYVVPGSPMHKLILMQNVSVMGFQGIEAARIRLTSPHVKLESVNMGVIFGAGVAQVMGRERTSRVPTLALTGVMIDGPVDAAKAQILEGADSVGGRIVAMGVETRGGAGTETFVSRLEWPDTQDDERYQCYGEKKATTRAACNSPYDPAGLPKDLPTVWDRPCESKEDCPYVSGSRGGCIDGSCELPVGVQRKSFRTAVAEPPYQPFCYNAKDPWDRSGCESVRDPVYAFKGDGGFIDLRATADDILLES
jgi:hypothetical protein